jgi:Arc/MetJ-type ribon-helix-helix transcriptional regulator
MKISVSISDDDLAFVDRQARDGRTTRSAVIRDAISELRQRDLAAAYAAASEEWAAGGGGSAWDATSGDGLR